MTGTANEIISFSFGENWLDFLNTVDGRIVDVAAGDIEHWLGEGGVRGCSVVDVGSGSGLSSLGFIKSGCAKLTSLDVDPKSVEATTSVARGHPAYPDSWTVLHGSILEDGFVSRLGQFDIVYSWGVLHHSGEMWRAVDNAASLCRAGGLFWISIYQGGPRYEADLALKRRYNVSDEAGKRLMVEAAVARQKELAAAAGRDPESWNVVNERGMNVYHDIVDWLGGLPYEVARPSEILARCAMLGLEPLKVQEEPEGGCSIYLMRKVERVDPLRTFDYARPQDGTVDKRTTLAQQSDELQRADALFLRAKTELEARATAAERRAALLEGKLNSGRDLIGAMLHRIISRR